MQEKWGRLRNSFLIQTSKLMGVFKYYLLVFFIFFLIAFVTGVMTCTKYASSVSCDNLINKYLLSYLTKDSSYLTFFLMMSVYYLLITIFSIIFTRNIFVVILDGVVLLLISYILGFDCCIVIVSLGLSGVIFGILVYALLGILSLMAMIFVFCLANKFTNLLYVNNFHACKYVTLLIH